jgi:hypothetical protein
MADDQEATPNQVYVASGYGANTRRPFVSLRVKDVAVMMRPEEAREIAQSLTEASEAALSDMFVIEWVMERIGGTLDQAAMMVREFREVRERRRGDERDGPSAR